MVKGHQWRFSSWAGPVRPAEPLSLVVNRWSDLPRVGIAALTAEGYFPFGETRHEAADLSVTAGS